MAAVGQELPVAKGSFQDASPGEHKPAASSRHSRLSGVAGSSRIRFPVARWTH
jgi:hypothetical protein